MATLPSVVPDIDVLLSLSDEELARIVLRLANEHKQNGSIHPAFFVDQINSSREGQPGYPPARRKEAEQAFYEAWNWLTVNGAIFEPYGNNGHMQFSRKGRKLLDDQVFKSYTESIAFPRALLHPAFADTVWIDFARGDYDAAVFKAFRTVEVAVREAGGYSNSDFGVKLMRKAFGNGGALADMTEEAGEQEALANLFAGAIGYYKNPQSHRAVNISASRSAQEMLMLASHLLGMVDARKPGA